MAHSAASTDAEVGWHRGGLVRIAFAIVAAATAIVPAAGSGLQPVMLQWGAYPGQQQPLSHYLDNQPKPLIDYFGYSIAGPLQVGARRAAPLERR